MMYTLYGTMNVDFGLWLSFWCSFGILIGIALLDWLITKFNGRQSLLLFTLVFMLILSALLIAVIAVLQAFEKDPEKKELLWGFSDVCD